jgi:WD40 repeat protein
MCAAVLAGAAQSERAPEFSVPPSRLIAKAHSDHVRGLRFSRDGRLLASGSADGTIAVWDARTLHLVRRVVATSPGAMSLSAFDMSPDGRLLAGAKEDGTIGLWRVEDGALLRGLAGHNEGVIALAFNRDGSWLASSGTDHKVRVWNVTTGAALKELDHPNDWVRTMAFSPAEDRLVVAGTRIGWWRPSTGEQLEFGGHDRMVEGLAFNADGSLLLSAGNDGAVKLWDMKDPSNRPVVLQIFEADTRAAAINEKYSWVAASYDSVLTIWNLQMNFAYGSEITRLVHGSGTVYGVFSPEGRWLAASVGNDLALWDLETVGSLSVETSPGATVRLDEKLLGRADGLGRFVAHGLAPKSYILSVALPGYQSFIQAEQISLGTLKIKAPLRKLPFSFDELREMLRAGVSNARAKKLIDEYGVDFELASKQEEELRRLGADDGLVLSIVRNKK